MDETKERIAEFVRDAPEKMLPKDDKPRLLRFRDVTYREGDVIVLCEPSDPGANTATLLLVTWDEEFGITELLPLRFAALRVLNHKKWEAVCETVDKLRNPVLFTSGVTWVDGPKCA